MTAPNIVEPRDIRINSYDMAGARAWMEEVCGPHSLQSAQPERVSFRHSARVFKSYATTLGTMEYGADVRIGVEGSDHLDSYSLSLPLTGEQELIYRGSRVQSNRNVGIIVSPFHSQELLMAGNCRKISVVIPRVSMRLALEEILKRPVEIPINFDPVMDSQTGASGSWWRLVAHFVSEQEVDGGVFDQTLFSRDIEAAMVRGLILAQKNNYTNEIQETLIGKLPSYLVRAKDFIHANAREDVRLEDIEAAAGVSRFKLFDGFRKHMGMSPMAYLKKFRLSEVRKHLLTGGRGTNISTVATEWGFNHLGRFASEYRKLFNEMPSATLHRNDTTRAHMS
ncbi:TPA: AraC family transcriptional regulator [Pseudomonas putida]|uniref:AraC family transcriptional regulator n=1 Tax=Pseudomonas putida TaxID=303 RepID=UPI00110C918A|nr:AraC family transcriptional regulator [Pseudomonas putida]MDD1992748.1 AraC family transcriptional regulator [Pseudomonas putida]HDS0918410.1 AraC family transcriptional regulator [Pseudomonas putida]HDS0931691.1 AraC family transcriptional regulator [Pseudomonas putida]HDS1782319.1 AraC family transcriptional regulator [Pseudomonas putida]HDS3796968.1 AraC family transcriptional regulator [Pseudomonas putida]